MRKTQLLINKHVYLGLSILDLNTTVIYKFWYDYVKPKHGENAKLCTLLHGYRQLHCTCKNKWNLQRYYRRCWKKI